MKFVAGSTNVLIVQKQANKMVEISLAELGCKLNFATEQQEALDKAVVIKPDVIFIEVGTNLGSSIELCYELREHETLKNSYILLYGAQVQDFEIISGLQAGADDYWMKPINSTLFQKKVRAVIKRSRSAPATVSDKSIRLESFVIDRDTYTAKLQGVTLHLPKKEFELIWLLASSPEKVFTRQEIIDQLWSIHANVSERTVDVHIKNVRQKIGEDKILTIKGHGYKLGMSA